MVLCYLLVFFAPRCVVCDCWVLSSWLPSWPSHKEPFNIWCNRRQSNGWSSLNRHHKWRLSYWSVRQFPNWSEEDFNCTGNKRSCVFCLPDSQGNGVPSLKEGQNANSTTSKSYIAKQILVTGSPTAALHIAQLCSAAQCQSQAWIKEEGDGKSLCFYTLSYASLCLQYKSKASTLAFDFIVAQLCSHTSVTSPVSPSSWILLSML